MGGGGGERGVRGATAAAAEGGGKASRQVTHESYTRCGKKHLLTSGLNWQRVLQDYH
jgi:hypothetical protein